MSKIGLVIDSTTIMNSQDIEKYGIEVVSLNVQINEKMKKENQTEDSEVIESLNNDNTLKSSSPSPYEFEKAYQNLFNKGFEKIVVIPLSQELSSTSQSAAIAKSQSDREKDIYIVETNICNYGNANLIESVLPLLDKDIEVEELINTLNERAKNSNVQFTILDLNPLIKGGRLSKIGGAIGMLFKIKPIIEMIGGKLKVVRKERTYRVILNTFINKVGELAKSFKHVQLKIVTLHQQALADSIIKEIKEKYKNVVITTIDRVGPVFNIHLGDNGLGIACTAFN